MPYFFFEDVFTLQESQHCLALAWLSDSLFAFICFEPLDSTLAISFSLVILSFKFEELSSWFVELLLSGSFDYHMYQVLAVHQCYFQCQTCHHLATELNQVLELHSPRADLSPL